MPLASTCTILSVKNDGDRDGEHQELDESGDLAGEGEEDRNDSDDAEEQWPEQLCRYETRRH